MEARVDYARVAAHARVVVDTRGVLASPAPGEHVIGLSGSARGPLARRSLARAVG